MKHQGRTNLFLLSVSGALAMTRINSTAFKTIFIFSDLLFQPQEQKAGRYLEMSTVSVAV